MNADKIMEVVCNEIDKIAEKGLTTSNLETAYKLIDMYKDLKTVEGMEDYADEEYSQRGRGRNAKRDSMGRYARTYDDGMSMRYGDGMSRRYENGNSYMDGYEQRYMNAKRMYRNDHSNASKQNMLDAVDEYMDEIQNKLKEMKRDADTPEEREMIDKYVKMLDKM